MEHGDLNQTYNFDKNKHMSSMRPDIEMGMDWAPTPHDYSTKLGEFHYDGIIQRRSRPMGQFQNAVIKPIMPFLNNLYLRALRMQHLARNVYVFHMQSIYLSRQALHLVIRLNEAVDVDEGPSDEEYDERNDLEDELIEVYEAMKAWGSDEEDGVHYEQCILKIRQQYSLLFKERFYFHDIRCSSTDPSYLKAVAYDEKTIRYRQRQRAHLTSSTTVEINYWKEPLAHRASRRTPRSGSSLRNSHLKRKNRATATIRIHLAITRLHASRTGARKYGRRHGCRLEYEEELLDGVVSRMYDPIGDTAEFPIGYAKRVPAPQPLRSTISPRDQERIKPLQGDFSELNIEFDRAVDRAVLTVTRRNEESDLFRRLRPVEAANYQEDRSCTEGTHTTVLGDIIDWIAKPVHGEIQPNGSNDKIFWLYGMPASGKTTVAHSLCGQLRRSQSLGGMFFCQHGNPELRDPHRILPTLIAELMRTWGPFRRLVTDVLLHEPQINPESTSGELLLKPLRLLKKHPPQPFVLVIDALDECGEPHTRQALLKCLMEACYLVPWLKIVLTSRPERDIKAFFDTHYVTRRDLSKDDSAREDIRLFTECSMASVAGQRHLPSDWPDQECVTRLVELSDGLFIFVETLYRLVDVPEPELLLAQVLGRSSEGANNARIWIERPEISPSGNQRSIYHCNQQGCTHQDPTNQKAGQHFVASHVVGAGWECPFDGCHHARKYRRLDDLKHHHMLPDHDTNYYRGRESSERFHIPRYTQLIPMPPPRACLLTRMERPDLVPELEMTADPEDPFATYSYGTWSSQSNSQRNLQSQPLQHDNRNRSFWAAHINCAHTPAHEDNNRFPSSKAVWSLDSLDAQERLSGSLRPSSLPGSDALVYLLDAILGSQPIMGNEMEPSVNSSGGRTLLEQIQATDPLQNAPPDIISIYALFVDHSDFRCRLCGISQSSMDTAIWCVRSHLSDRPHPCEEGYENCIKKHIVKRPFTGPLLEDHLKGDQERPRVIACATPPRRGPDHAEGQHVDSGFTAYANCSIE